ncbi:hypothetical protein [Aeromicrobium sp. CTD01-1L150]|uniref:hypothetical protein n=1 Tax=Aeromicrobium sp. CTD01-1L150 TaxID=3341830 RepID=UPI0035C04049
MGTGHDDSSVADGPLLSAVFAEPEHREESDEAPPDAVIGQAGTGGGHAALQFNSEGEGLAWIEANVFGDKDLPAAGGPTKLHRLPWPTIGPRAVATGLSLILTVAIAATLWLGLVPRLPDNDADRNLAPTQVTEVGETRAFTEVLGDEVWSSQRTAGAPAVATRAGVVELSDERATIRSVSTGEQLDTFGVPGRVDAVFDATLDGTTALVLRSGSTLTIWSEGALAEARLPDGASVSAAGDGVLIMAGSDQWALTGQGDLVEVALPARSTPMGVVGERLIAADPDGTLFLADFESDAAPRQVDLVAPDNGSRIARWAGLGRDKVAVIWRSPARTVFAVHKTTTGEPLAVAELSDEAAAGGQWRRGRGAEVATFASLVVDLHDGQITRYDDDVELDGGYGAWSTSIDGVLLQGSTALKAERRLLAITDDVVLLEDGGQLRGVTLTHPEPSEETGAR